MKISVSKTAKVILLIFCLTAGATADQDTVNVLENTDDQVVIHYVFGDFTSRPIDVNGQIFTQIYLAGESLKKDVGAPALPDVSRSIIIPDDARMVVSVLDSSYYEIEDIDIAPSKGFILRTINPNDVPYTFGSAYEADAFYPGPVAVLRKPYIMRDHRGIVVTANPFQYNPVQRLLRVYTDMTVQVSVVGKGEANVLKRNGHERLLSRAFRDIYSSHFLNYDTGASVRYTPLNEEGDMLIIVHDPWISNVQPLVDHKNSIGINTTIVGVSTIGNDATLIKNYIQNAYNLSDLVFVLLVGDAAQVATPSASGGASDPSYSKLAGDDDYPDILVGRFSAETAADVDTQVQRTIEYENMPAIQQDWFWRGTGIASNDGTGNGDDNEWDWEHIRNIRTDLLDYGYTDVDELYEGDQSGEDAPGNPTSQMVADCLNAGRGIINYCGHGSTTTWVTTGFSVSSINALVNDSMLPFIFDVACVNGQFAGYTCFAEAWLRATHNDEPTGAVGIYASSINQSWAPPMEAQDEFNFLYVAQAYNTYGALCFAGSCSMMDAYGSGGVSMFNTWHIFGDPSLLVVGTAIARNPSPVDGATDVNPNIVLSWTPGTYASSHDVYFGTDYNSVLDANHSSSEYKGNQPLDYNSYDPGTLDYSTTYYWVIDEVNEANTWPGDVWRFTTAASPDTNAPTPDPMTWATVPYATSSTSISMTATTASDLSGVEYYFECTVGSGHDSGWQDSPTYEDIDLQPETQYTYRVKARDKSTNQNETAPSTAESATTDPVAPTDDVVNSDIPVAGTVSGSYTNTQNSDNIYEAITERPSGGKPSKRHSYLEHKWTINVTGGNLVTFYVEAYHTSNSEGDNFVFAYSTDDLSYTDMVTVIKTADDDAYQGHVLPATISGTVYIRVKDTDQTQGNRSLDTIYVDHMYIKSVTGGPPDTTPPTPDPMTWATLPYATGSTSIAMVATTASDPSGMEYYFTCTAGGGNDSGWQDSASYEDTGLTPDTTYTYTVTARDKSVNQNATAPSTAESATTDAQPGDVVTITKAQYTVRKSELWVEASSSSGGTATLTVVGYGTMENLSGGSYYKYRQKPVADPGGTVTVTSSLGGSDTATVTYK